MHVDSSSGKDSRGMLLLTVLHVTIDVDHLHSQSPITLMNWSVMNTYRYNLELGTFQITQTIGSYGQHGPHAYT